MGHFSELYENLAKDYLAEQDQVDNKNVDVMPETPPDVDAGDANDTTQELNLDKASALEEVEEDSIKVDWVKKIIRLLTLLNRQDESVERILSDLSSGAVNADTLKNKENQIEELLRTIPTEKNI
jgi:hypothetical protein